LETGKLAHEEIRVQRDELFERAAGVPDLALRCIGQGLPVVHLFDVGRHIQHGRGKIDHIGITPDLEIGFIGPELVPQRAERQTQT